MLSDEEKEIFKNLKEYMQNNINNGYHKFVYNDLGWDFKCIDCINAIDTAINLIRKQSKEIEELKKEHGYMESWDINKRKNIKTPEKVINFLNEIDNICKKYNLSISHEDSHGAFILEKYDKYNIKWLKDCLLNLEKEY